jgi:hypothetical protein
MLFRRKDKEFSLTILNMYGGSVQKLNGWWLLGARFLAIGMRCYRQSRSES